MMSFRIRCIAGLACIRVISDSLTLSEVAAVDDTNLEEELPAHLLAFFLARHPRRPFRV